MLSSLQRADMVCRRPSTLALLEHTDAQPDIYHLLELKSTTHPLISTKEFAHTTASCGLMCCLTWQIRTANLR